MTLHRSKKTNIFYITSILGRKNIYEKKNV